MEMFCAQNKAISDNSDVFIGFVAWGAGSFESDYILNLSPSGSPGSYEDNALMKECVLKPFIEDAGPLPTTTSSKTKTKSTSTKTKSSDQTTTATMASSSAKSTDRVFKEEDQSSSAAASATETGAAKASATAGDNAGTSRGVQVVTGGLMLGMALFLLCA